MTAALDWLLGELPGIIFAPDRAITPDTTLASLGVDRIDLVEIEVEAEDHFGIELPEGALDGKLTVGGLAAAIQAHCP